MTTPTITRHEWHGCYANGWKKDDISPEAFSHPAKFSKQLIRRIYEHLLAQGYVKPGDVIADPFGGVGLGAFWAIRYGLHWRGVELEPKFVEIGRQNFELWNGRYAPHFANWGTAEIIQGDSRELCKVLGQGGAVIGSPPYAGSLHTNESPEVQLKRIAKRGGRLSQFGINSLSGNQGYSDSPGQLGAMKEGQPPTAFIGSPPYANSVNANDAANDSEARKERRLSVGIPDTPYHNGGPNSQQNRPQVYGNADGQLGAMKEGQPPQALIGSPPYADAVSGQGEGPGARYDHTYHKGDNATKNSSQAAYGVSDGQLGGMHVIGSPPFEKSQAGGGLATPGVKHQDGYELNRYSNGYQNQGDAPGQLGNATGSTFWQAARDIVEQCYQLLPSGGVAVWVTGDFVRNKQRVHFGRQWLALCQEVGFVPVEHIVAWKREPGPIQAGIFEDVDMTIDRVSFFRRLANQNNPEAAILNEDVWIVRKP